MIVPVTSTDHRPATTAARTTTATATITSHLEYGPGQPGRRPATGAFPHITRTKLAKAAKLDVTHVSHILSGRSAPKLSAAVNIANALGITVEELDKTLSRFRRSYKRKRAQPVDNVVP